MATRTRTTTQTQTEPSGSDLITFGKHKGKTFDQIITEEKGYTSWALSVDGGSENMKKFQRYARKCSGQQSQSGRERSPRREQAACSEQASSTVTLRIQQSYLDYIRSGRKSVEGRVSTPQLASLKVNDIIKLECGRDFVNVKVVEVMRFPSFRQMLDSCGLDKCLPGCPSVKAGVAIYHGFPGYEEKARRHGVVAFRVVV